MKEIKVGVEKLRLKFPEGKSLIFRDLSLFIEKGEKVLILGPSGCGKSTLLQVLAGIIPGSIEVPVKWDASVFPEHWGYVFQDPDTQFCMPFVDEEMAFVLENLQVPREKMSAMISKYLEEAGLQLGDPHTEIRALSQGMKQRLAIASVLALDPEVLFLDEPTALLDPEGTKQIWETLKQSAENKTIVIVEHKIDHIIEFVDRILLFNDKGEMIADGSPGAVFNSHRNDLIRYGIWYPDVWNEYISGDHFKAILSKRNVEKEINLFLKLEEFTAYRGGIPKVYVSKAEVGNGEWISVIGDNGAGKSTLLLSLMGILETKGDFILHGKKAGEYKELSDFLALVFQNPEWQFVTDSVYDEVAFSLRGEEDRQHADLQIQNTLDLFQLTEYKDRHPYQLSLGQKRRLSVATAVVKKRDILLLDEPTFGQDAANTFALLEMLENYRRQGVTIIMVTHDLEIVKHFSTRIWSIMDGKLTEEIVCGST